MPQPQVTCITIGGIGNKMPHTSHCRHFTFLASRIFALVSKVEILVNCGSVTNKRCAAYSFSSLVMTSSQSVYHRVHRAFLLYLPPLPSNLFIGVLVGREYGIGKSAALLRIHNGIDNPSQSFFN